MKTVSAKAPMSSKAKAVLEDRGQARQVFATVIEARSAAGQAQRYSVSGLKYRSLLAPRKTSAGR